MFYIVGQYLHLKMRALAEYEFEMREWPHARSIRALECLARWRGASVGVEAAEGFLLIETRDDFGGHPRALVFAAEPLPEWLTNAGKKGLETP